MVDLELSVETFGHLNVCVNSWSNLFPNPLVKCDHHCRTEAQLRVGLKCKQILEETKPGLLVEEGDHLTIRLGLQRTAQSVEVIHGALRVHPQD